MLKLCKQCEIKLECDKKCSEAIEFEQEDHSINYMKTGEYKPTGQASKTWFDMRQSGGLNKFV